MDAGEQINRASQADPALPQPRISAELPAVRTRAVVAVVRPLYPNVEVLRQAARLAMEHGVALLVLGTLDPLVADWVDGIDVAGPALEAAHGELFATCVELLWEHELAWGVNVLWGRLAPEVNRLTDHLDVVTVVHGSRRPHAGLHRLRRLLTGRIDTLLGDLDVRAV